MPKRSRIPASSGNLARLSVSSRCRLIPISGTCHGLPVLQPRPTCLAMCPRRLFQARGGSRPRPSRRLLSLAVCPMLAAPVSCVSSRVSSSGGKLQAQGRRAGLSSTRPFRPPPVRWRALSHGRQGAQDAQREHMLLRHCRSPSAKPSGRLLQQAWRPVRSRSTSACRLPPCARCSRAPSRAGANWPPHQPWPDTRYPDHEQDKGG